MTAVQRPSSDAGFARKVRRRAGSAAHVPEADCRTDAVQHPGEAGEATAGKTGSTLAAGSCRSLEGSLGHRSLAVLLDHPQVRFGMHVHD
jgi:hypothetical protein